MPDDRGHGFQGSAARIGAFASLSYAVDYSFQLVDIFWVARLGAGAPTAIAVASSALFLVLALNEVVGAGTVPLFAQAAGSGDRAADRPCHPAGAALQAGTWGGDGARVRRIHAVGGAPLRHRHGRPAAISRPTGRSSGFRCCWSRRTRP